MNHLYTFSHKITTAIYNQYVFYFYGSTKMNSLIIMVANMRQC